MRENGRLRPASWKEAFDLIAAKRKATAPARTGAIVGDLAAAEEIFALKLLCSPRRVVARLPAGRRALDPKLGRASYLFNSDDRRH
ncbi:molybdopterin-dependent oxidoreductase [Methylocystis parvus]|uniref:molybdopterin-dependent oxidoreductase n=1 Tax=Methylocystis parvus TaxID=134 RepID=UPI003C715714